ncbi:hypothetical protein QT20_00130, partial [Staphylococcus aureus]
MLIGVWRDRRHEGGAGESRRLVDDPDQPGRIGREARYDGLPILNAHFAEKGLIRQDPRQLIESLEDAELGPHCIKPGCGVDVLAALNAIA